MNQKQKELLGCKNIAEAREFRSREQDSAISSVIELVTPERASHYLSFNEGNRNVRTTRVKELSGVIRRGEWMVTHQGIAFSRDGRLIDGQHRLLACIDADTPIKIMVTRNVEPDAFKALDLHGKRSMADIFGISTHLAACFQFIGQAFYGDKGVGPQQIQAVMGTELARTCASLCHNGGQSSPIARTAWIVGCAVHCVNGSREYSAALYDNIRLCNTSKLPPIGESFFRQHQNGSLRVGNNSTARREAFAKALVLFDPKKRKNLIIKAMAVDEAMQILRDAVPELQA